MLKKISSAVIVPYLFFGAVFLWSLPCEANWIRTYGGTLVDSAFSVRKTSDGGYIMAGENASFGAGSRDAWLLKLDGSGNVTWQKTYGGTAWEYATAIQQTTDGGYIVAGGTESFGAGSEDAWLLKLDGSGNVTWQKTYGGAALEVTHLVQQTTDGGYIVVGYTASFGAGNADIWLLKLDGSGNVLWQKTYGGTAFDFPQSAQQTTDGGYIVAGGTASFGAGSTDAWLLKLDGGGNVTWQKTYGGTAWEYATAIQQTTDGGYIVVGRTESFGAGSEDTWLLKLDGSGNVLWQKTYGGTGSDFPLSAQQTTDGGYVVAGGTASFGAGSNDAWLLKLDESGNVLWQKTYGGTASDFIRSAQQTTDGGYVVAGDTDSFGAGSNDAWLLKLDENGLTDSCPFEGISTAIVSDTAATVIDTNAITGTTSIAGVNTTIIPIASNAMSSEICPTAFSLLSPNGGENLATDSDWTVRWWTAPSLGASSFKLSYSLDNGTTWSLIGKGITEMSTTWTTPLLIKNKTKCLVKVVALSDQGVKVGSDKSDRPFTIEAVTLTYPNGGETFTSGIAETVHWTNNVKAATTANLYYTLNNGLTWKEIPEIIDLSVSPSSYSWTPPVVLKERGKCKMKIVLKDAAGMKVGSDVSDRPFKIAP